MLPSPASPSVAVLSDPPVWDSKAIRRPCSLGDERFASAYTFDSEASGMKEGRPLMTALINVASYADRSPLQYLVAPESSRRREEFIQSFQQHASSAALADFLYFTRRPETHLIAIALIPHATQNQLDHTMVSALKRMEEKPKELAEPLLNSLLKTPHSIYRALPAVLNFACDAKRPASLRYLAFEVFEKGSFLQDKTWTGQLEKLASRVSDPLSKTAVRHLEKMKEAQGVESSDEVAVVLP